mgnify:CR=1 FL=1
MNEKRLAAVVREQDRRKGGRVYDFTHLSDKELEAYRKQLQKEEKV